MTPQGFYFPLPCISLKKKDKKKIKFLYLCFTRIYKKLAVWKLYAIYGI